MCWFAVALFPRFERKQKRVSDSANAPATLLFPWNARRKRSMLFAWNIGNTPQIRSFVSQLWTLHLDLSKLDGELSIRALVECNAFVDFEMLLLLITHRQVFSRFLSHFDLHKCASDGFVWFVPFIVHEIIQLWTQSSNIRATRRLFSLPLDRFDCLLCCEAVKTSSANEQMRNKTKLWLHLTNWKAPARISPPPSDNSKYGLRTEPRETQLKCNCRMAQRHISDFTSAKRWNQ